MRTPRPPHCQTGVAAVELAFVIFFLLLLVAGIVEFGRAFWYYDALTKATRDGARYLSTANRMDIASPTFVSDTAQRVADIANTANLRPALATGDVTITCMDSKFDPMACSNVGSPTVPNSDPLRYVQVAITGYRIDIGGMFPFLPPGSSQGKAYRDVGLEPQTTMRYMMN